MLGQALLQRPLGLEQHQGAVFLITDTQAFCLGLGDGAEGHSRRKQGDQTTTQEDCAHGALLCELGSGCTCLPVGGRVRWENGEAVMPAQMLQRAVSRRSLSTPGATGLGRRAKALWNSSSESSPRLECGGQLRGLAVLAVGDLAVVGEDPLQGLLRLECRQHRLEGVIHRQHVGDAAASGNRQDHLVLQRALRQQVEQGFQRTGERRLVHRRGDYQAVGLGDQLLKVLDLWAVEAGVEQVLGREFAHRRSPPPRRDPAATGASARVARRSVNGYWGYHREKQPA